MSDSDGRPAREPISFRYVVTRATLESTVSVVLASARRGRWRRIAPTALAFLLLGAFLSYGSLLVSTARSMAPIEPHWVVISIGAGVLFAGLYTVSSLVQQKPASIIARAMRDPTSWGGVGEVTIEVTSDGLRSSSRLGDSFVPWYRMSRLDRLAGGLVLYAGAECALVLVLHMFLFASPAEAEAFFDRVELEFSERGVAPRVCHECGLECIEVEGTTVCDGCRATMASRGERAR